MPPSNNQPPPPSLRDHITLSILVCVIFVMVLIYWLGSNDTSAPGNTLSSIPLQVKDSDEPIFPQQSKTTQNSPQNNPKENNPSENNVLTPIKPQTSRINGQKIDKTKTAKQNDVSHFTPLSIAPLKGLTRASSQGLVPSISASGLTALEAYAKPYIASSNKHKIAIVISGLGINPYTTRLAIMQLPENISLSFAAQAPNLQSWINQARARGHEVIIEIPLDNGASALSSSDSARLDYTLKVGETKERNIRRLDYLLSRATGYFAVTNYGGTAFIENEAVVSVLISYLKNAGLGLVYDALGNNKLLYKNTRAQALTFSPASALLDAQGADIDVSLRHLQILQKQSQQPDPQIPIGIGFAYPETINAVQDWIDDLPDSVVLVPLSHALQINTQ